MKISLTNSKLGAQIPSINLPPITTCREKCPCASLCYANKGNFRFENVKKSHVDNLKHYQANPDNYFDSIIAWLNGMVAYKFFRWHSSGDIVDMRYLEGIVRVAKECSQTKFLVFTKKYELINDYVNHRAVDFASFREMFLPNNLKIVFSMWDKDFNKTVQNPYHFPTTWVDFKDKSKNGDIPEDAIYCIGSCDKCTSCWTLRSGQATVFHQH